MSVFILKIIAIIGMVIDHTATVLKGSGVPYESVNWMNIVGRMVFPIFAFLIVNGWEHTHSKKKYMFNMFLFGVISQIPFVYALFWEDGTVSGLVNLRFTAIISRLNVFFTFLIAMYCIWCIEKTKEIRHSKGSTRFLKLCWWIPLLLWIVHPFILMRMLRLVHMDVDYGWSGILLVVVLYLLRRKRWAQCAAIVIWGVLMYNNWVISPTGVQFSLAGWQQMLSVAVGALLVYCYNGKKGPCCKYLFYVIYPVHLAVLAYMAVYVL